MRAFLDFIRSRRLLLVGWLVLLVGLGAIAAAWAWSAWHMAVARRHAAAGQFADAWQQLERARTTWPTSAAAHLLAARVAGRLGKVELAYIHLEAHEKQRGNPDERAFQRRLLRAQEGELDEYEALLQLVNEQHPDSDAILEALAQGCIEKKQIGGLERLLKAWPDPSVNSCWRGKVHYQLGQFHQASADLAPCVEQNPEWDELRLELAQAYYRSGHAAEAVPHLRLLQSKAHALSEVLLLLGMSLQDQSNWDAAATALDSLLEREPHHTAGQVERARVALRQGRPRDGERWALQVIAADPTAIDAVLVLAHCLEAMGRKTEAQEQLDRWQRLDAARYHLGLVLPQLGRSPNDARLLFEAGSSFLTLGNQDLGLEILDRALKADPQHRATHRHLGQYYNSLGQRERAQMHLRAAAD